MLKPRPVDVVVLLPKPKNWLVTLELNDGAAVVKELIGDSVLIAADKNGLEVGLNADGLPKFKRLLGVAPEEIVGAAESLCFVIQTKI